MPTKKTPTVEVCKELVLSNLRSYERLFTVWGHEQEVARKCIEQACEEWYESPPLEISKSSFVGVAGYRKEDET